MAQPKRIVVVGANFAGLTVASELRRLAPELDVLVLSRSRDFIFLPSLIWVPFGLRRRADITFPLAPVLERKGARFIPCTVTSLDLPGREVHTSAGDFPYDYLVLCTGPKPHYAAIPGLGPSGPVHSILSIEEAERAARGFEALLQAPGPVVVGSVQGASYLWVAYELLFNLAYQLRQRGVKLPLTFITPEPALGHLGMGGLPAVQRAISDFCARLGITVVTNAKVRDVSADAIHISHGGSLPFAFSLLVPPLIGVDAVRAATEIVDDEGFVRVNDTYQSSVRPEVFAAGAAISIQPRVHTQVPCGVPKSGYLAEEMARILAQNLVATLHGEPLVHLPPAEIDASFLIDAGNTGLILSVDHLLDHSERVQTIPGPEAHWAKLSFEKYFLASRRRGRI